MLLAGCGGSSGDSSSKDEQKAIAAAKFIFDGRAARQNMSSGPCIAETIPGVPDWAADVAHDPRQPIDDRPQNQCASFREGRTHHFVELDPQGNLIHAE